MAQTTIAKMFNPSAINGQTARMLESSEVQQKALRISSQSPESLQRKIERSNRVIGGRREQAESIHMVNSYGDVIPESKERLFEVTGKLARATKSRAGLMGAARIQKMQGLDSESRMDVLVNLGEKAKNIIAAQSPEIKKLQAQSAVSFQNDALAATKTFAEALNNLRTATGQTAEEMKVLRKKAEEAGETMAKFETAKGGGGGGRVDRGFVARAAETFLGAASQGIQQVGVNQRLAQQSNTAGYADFQNQIYQTYKAANAGDVASLMLLPKFQDAEVFGGELHKTASASVGAQVLSSLMGAGAGAWAGFEGGAVAGSVLPGIGTLGGAVIGGIGGGIIGLTNAAVGGFDFGRNVSSGQADIAGRQVNLSKCKRLSLRLNWIN